MSVRRNKGFTLIEALIAVAIVGVIAAFAFPAMQSVQASSRIRSATTDITSVISDARAQAAGRQRSLTLKAIDGDWQKGWTLAFTTPITGVGDLAAHRGLPASLAITVTPDLDAVVFLPNGMIQKDDGSPIASLVFQICDSRSGVETGRNVTLTRVGRATVKQHADADVCN